MNTPQDLEFLNSKASKSAPTHTDKRFDVTKTGLTGLQRDTMLQNELHFLVSVDILTNLFNFFLFCAQTYALEY